MCLRKHVLAWAGSGTVRLGQGQEINVIPLLLLRQKTITKVRPFYEILEYIIVATVMGFQIYEKWQRHDPESVGQGH